jgi:hypothetical protein
VLAGTCTAGDTNGVAVTMRATWAGGGTGSIPWRGASWRSDECGTAIAVAGVAERGSDEQRMQARDLYSRPHLPQGAPTSPALANISAFRDGLPTRRGWYASSAAECTRYAAVRQRIAGVVVNQRLNIKGDEFTGSRRFLRIVRGTAQQARNRQKNPSFGAPEGKSEMGFDAPLSQTPPAAQDDEQIAWSGTRCGSEPKFSARCSGTAWRIRARSGALGTA